MRISCSHCNRPSKVCICDAIEPVYHKTPVVILQDKAEAKHPFNTAIIAKLALEYCHITTEQPFKQRVLDSYPNTKPLLLFPHLDLSGSAAYLASRSVAATDSASFLNQLQLKSSSGTEIESVNDEHIEKNARVLVVIDATWRKAKRIYLEHCWLQRLPKLNIATQTRSAYHIRQTKKESFLSTIESIGLALSHLEHEFDNNALLKPFEKMVQMHIR